MGVSRDIGEELEIIIDLDIEALVGIQDIGIESSI
jgi:hypothetical protein